MSKSNNYAIGVFDSGLGGLTVVKELMKQLPCEDIVYYGDTARVPYGTKSRESIIRFSKENAEVLLKQKVKIIVVACNSSSSYALSSLKKRFNLPIIGVVAPGAQKAVTMTKNRKVGVIATSATVQSRQYAKIIKRLSPSIKVFSQPCPLFVPLVEEGWLQRDVTRRVAKEYLVKLKQSRVDTLILGCTHYPLLRNVIQKAMGQGVALVDSAKEVATEVNKTLGKFKKYRISKRRPRYQFLVSDKPQEFCRIAKNFLGRDIKAVKV